jgi:hypothetical protein
MDLVTVTCNRDFQHMMLQAESIQKFLEPCKHWIIINEYEDLNIDAWVKELDKYYTKHQYKIVTPYDFKINSLPHRKWHAQQYFKLAISTLIDNDYLVLDTKNFFIRPTDLKQWNDTMGSGTLYKFGESDMMIDQWNGISRYYANKLKSEPLTNFLFTPPFKIDISILKKYNMENLINDLYPTELENKLYHELTGKKLFPSEFIFYSYLAQSYFDEYKSKERSYLLIMPVNIENKNNHQIFKEIIHKTTTADKNTNINNFAFHPLLFKSLSTQHIHYINYWLRKKDFKFQFNCNIS